MKKDKKGKDAISTAWEMFEKTGQISYYSFYKSLSKKDEK